MKHRRTFAVGLALVLLAPLGAAAQEPLSWIIYETLKPGSEPAWVKLVTETYGPVLDRMMGEGKVLAWGLLDRMTYDGGSTHAGFVTYPDWTAMEAVDQAIDAAMAERTPEARQQIGAKFNELTEPHAQAIRYVRHVVINVPEDAGAPKYLSTGEFTASGEGDPLAVYRQVAPAFDPLVADGTLTAYGLYVPELHDGAGWTHVSWLGLSSLGAMDKVQAALDAALTEELAAQAAEAFDLSQHTDQLWYVLHYGGSQEDDGGGDDGE